MNETLIKEIIKYKLNVAGTIIDHLPTIMSEEIKNLGRAVLEGVNESSQEIKEQQSKKAKSADKLENVPIE
ncbi:MAG: hypothetical protein JM58_10500 [Peptococcaceae bacterium BICA1-8]|nr:MAG: hypothetical protein JM58_10500 [Peptococcaceae bacterium BICA1-8]